MIGDHVFGHIARRYSMRKISCKLPATPALAFLAVASFGFSATPCEATAPPSACTYLAKAVDAQPGGPIFLPSFPTADIPALKGTAYLYDNAVATIALIGCGEKAKAQRIGDAMLAALERDRYWRDGRLRNAYRAGHVGSGAIKQAGYWDPQLNKWMEDAYQVGSDNGNMAWTILALLALDQQSGNRQYRDAAVRIGRWVVQWHSEKGVSGFTGGVVDEEPSPIPQTWKSTEHNVDLSAAFSGLAQVTGDRKWLDQAVRAQKFVRTMWRRRCNCFSAGIVDDGVTRNNYIALDAQILPLLALPGAVRVYDASLQAVIGKIRYQGGFAFGEVGKGIWTEGTQQVALYMRLTGRENQAQSLTKATNSLRTPDGGYYATNVKELPTGMFLDIDKTKPRVYFHIPHLAAAAWAALAERKFNPFTRNNKLP
jgi:hypothetical protein